MEILGKMCNQCNKCSKVCENNVDIEKWLSIIQNEYEILKKG